MFAPEDLNLVKGSPQIRRRFINMEIGQVSPVYLHQLNKYQKIIQQRNHYLKLLQTRKQKDEKMLDVLTLQLCETASNIIKKDICLLNSLKNGHNRFIPAFQGEWRN